MYNTAKQTKHTRTPLPPVGGGGGGARASMMRKKAQHVLWHCRSVTADYILLNSCHLFTWAVVFFFLIHNNARVLLIVCTLKHNNTTLWISFSIFARHKTANFSYLVCRSFCWSFSSATISYWHLHLRKWSGNDFAASNAICVLQSWAWLMRPTVLILLVRYSISGLANGKKPKNTWIRLLE